MENKSLALLSEKGIEIHKRLLECETIEELQAIVLDTEIFNEDKSNACFIELDISEEEFEKMYDLIDIDNLKGKYGF